MSKQFLFTGDRLTNKENTCTAALELLLETLSQKKELKNVLLIDGSYGEGGGQIVRTAVAFSVLTKQPIQITNIRAHRPIPGLRPQHYTALSCIQAMCDADVEGLSVNSTNLTVLPS